MADQDFEIIQRVLAGEKKAYAELVNRHKDRAMTLAVRMLRNREDAEEALQDAFIRAFNALPRFEWRSSFSTWFYRIVFNVCSTMLSRRGEEVVISADGLKHHDEWEPPSDDEAPDVASEKIEFQKIVHEEVERLPAVYGSVMTLFIVQDLSYDEIVEVTGLPIGTVKVRLFRARALLRRSVLQRLSEPAGRRTAAAKL